jgi:hypothetical protein
MNPNCKKCVTIMLVGKDQWKGIADYEYGEHGINFTQDKKSYFIPYSSILWIEDLSFESLEVK